MVGGRSEYQQLHAQLEGEESSLTDEELLAICRQLVVLAPREADSWWHLALELDAQLGELREQGGAPFREDPSFVEMIRAYDRAIELDRTDVAFPYNKGRNLAKAGLLDEAYDAFMLAGTTELAHPGDIEWPAAWHFESAAEVALKSGREDKALAAAQAAIDTGEADDLDAERMITRLEQEAAE
jgi:tetratricopeptide (TPR) repeat protein